MISRAFSSEVEPGSRQENASNPKSRAPFQFHRNGNGSSVFGGLRRRSWTALCVGILTSVAAQAASAADCPGHPDAIGTSRTIVVDPRAYPVIGTMQYAKTLPLADREVVLTFDDGPLPKYSNQIPTFSPRIAPRRPSSWSDARPTPIRKACARCAMPATRWPPTARTTPTGMDRLPLDRSRQEIEQGLASVTAALADVRRPRRSCAFPACASRRIEKFAASRGLQLWSADFPADDWRDVSAIASMSSRCSAGAKGQRHPAAARHSAAHCRRAAEDYARTKTRGYPIVHVVPATPDRPATPTEPQQWQLHPASEMVAASRWPKVPKFASAGPAALPVPALSDLDWHTTDLGGRASRRGRGVPLPQVAPWPRQTTLPPAGTLAALPIPAASLFKLPESARVTLLAASARRTANAQARSTEVSSAKLAGKSHGRTAAAQPPASDGQAAQAPQNAGATAQKPAAQGKRNGRSVRVAGLERR